jgi:hypothetical protein
MVLGQQMETVDQQMGTQQMGMVEQGQMPPMFQWRCTMLPAQKVRAAAQRWSLVMPESWQGNY